MAVSRLHVIVLPNARVSQISWSDDGTLVAHVAGVAREGRANKALISLIAERLGVPPSRVTLVKGVSSRHKILTIEGLTADEVSNKF